MVLTRLRVYEMFMGPLESSLQWNTQGLDGTKKWLDRVDRFVRSKQLVTENDGSLDYVFHSTLEKVSHDIDTLNLNTAISQMMIFVNEAIKFDTIYRPYMEGFIQMFACFAPHLGEELWESLGHEESITFVPWPQVDTSKLVLDEIEIIVQVNGKLRGKFTASKDISKQEMEERAKQVVLSHIEGKELRKIIAVPGKLVNIVV